MRLQSSLTLLASAILMLTACVTPKADDGFDKVSPYIGETKSSQKKEEKKAAPNTLEFEEVPFADAFSNELTGAERWDDGKAEVASYAARRPFAGKPRNFEETRITVAESLRTDIWVKPEEPVEGKPLVRVLRYTVSGTLQADQYSTMLGGSIFIDRGNPTHAYKATFSSLDWTGAMLKEIQLYAKPARFQANSHWDYQGLSDIDLDLPENTLLENQLPLTLRACTIKQDRKILVHLVPDQFGDTAIKPVAVPAVIARVKVDKAMTVGGRGMEPKELIKYDVRYSNGPSAEFYFSAQEPRLMVAYAHSDGRSGTLTKVSRYTYWQR